ncbi:zinc finger protein ubi-d4 A-like isoform X2 [Dendronephthya gigantea]|uniref:zinc finger protein ubi-d4 A-like isoform X2 n=1 Tax=Dendronephthya gigantea TaxID=151771 RepID=UPI00106DACBD|nr:zinc finger protein ubi-d4 A-like isoform X2 [Dendronephthya gigantea]
MAAKVGISSSRYKDALEQTSAYNMRLGFERKQRSPFLDAQTGVAQVNCHLWKSKLSRRAPAYPYQICSYPGRRWKRKPRPQPIGDDGDPAAEEASQVMTLPPNDTTLSQPAMPGVEVNSNFDEMAETADVEPIEESEEESEEESDPDDDGGSRRAGRFGRSSKKGLSAGMLNYKMMKVDPSTLKIKNYTKEDLAKMTYEERQKPYMFCGKRYKNGPGLKYHYTHYNHDQDGSSSETTEVNHPQALPGSPMIETNVQPYVTTTTVAVTKETRSGIANPNDYCDFCLGDATRNKKTLLSEELLSCADCGRCGHPSCLQFTAKLTAKVKQYRWQCIECKSCTFCGTSDNDDQLLFCDDCDRGYHMYCLNPPMDTPPEGSWVCKLCEEDENMMARNS